VIKYPIIQFVIAIATLSFAIPSAHATTLVLNTLADADNGDSLPGKGAGTSLPEAINYAASGNTINFVNTLSGGTIILALGQLDVANSLTIDASSLGAGITVGGDQLSRIFERSFGTTNVLNNLSLTNHYCIYIFPNSLC